MAVGASSGPDGPTRPVIFGQVSQRGGAAVSGASLTLADLSGEQLDRRESDNGGRYQLDPPSGGTFLVICALSTHQPRAALVAVADVSVRHDVVLSQAGASLSGTVRTAGSGQAIPGAVVTLTDVRGDVRAAATTGPDGGYGFVNLAEGDYTLTVAALGLQPVAHSIQVPGEGHISHDVQATARARLPGRVVTARTGAAVPEALVTVVDTDGTVVASVLSGDDGAFVFEDLHIGSYTLIATGYPPVATDVHLNAAQAPETVLTLRPPDLASDAGAPGANTATSAARE
jgi:uncharacterized protein YfaS (alpha-2-macroglobulin family)